jgi:flagellar biosynthesis/type III secretory pathway protein FliH
MNQVVIKVPRDKKKLTIIRAKDVIEKEIEKRNELLSALLELRRKKKEEGIKETAAEDNPEKTEDKPYFTEIFTISKSNQPTNIEFFSPIEPQIDWAMLEEEIQAAYDRGFREGNDTAKALAERELEKLRKMNRIIDSMVDSFKFEYLKQMTELKASVVNLAIVVAEQIIKYEVDKNQNFIISQANKILSELDKELIFKIYINPNDLEAFQTSKSNLLNQAIVDNTKLITDDSIEQGFCKLETSIGEFDGRLKTQLELIRQNLLEEISNISLEEEIQEITENTSSQFDNFNNSETASNLQANFDINKDLEDQSSQIQSDFDLNKDD